jgi:hypothetical protein
MAEGVMVKGRAVGEVGKCILESEAMLKARDNIKEKKFFD